MTTLYSVAAGLVVAAHLGFVVFVALGGLLAHRWSWIPWIHLPAAIWGIAIELGGWVCPLTPLENTLRARAGLSTSDADFVARYLLPVLYPAGLSRDAQLTLGFAVAAVNGAIYGWWLRRRRAAGRSSDL